MHQRRKSDRGDQAWDGLVKVAAQEVASVLRSLPPPVREELRRVAIVFEPKPSSAMVREGVDPSLLGLFEGDPVGASDVHPAPTRIFLFLENLWQEAAAITSRYRREVRRTLLHEIGHYLGWDEQELSARSLE